MDDNTQFVARTLRRAGVPPSDLDDAIQHTFIAVAGRLEDLHLGAERSFLFQVALNVASHARRKLARRREVGSDELPDTAQSPTTPEHLAERKEIRKLLDDIVDGMHETLRLVFTLHELEGMTAVEIAAFIGVPPGTVASRLRRARAHFTQNVAAIELALDLETAGSKRIEGPALLRRAEVSTLGRALLAAGSSACTSASTRIKTLSALGICIVSRRSGRSCDQRRGAETGSASGG